ncbi:hypothetical protein ASPWEDRAFT_62678 [Aspergillus wentii DTO 134E9]|uniref:Fungal N-terminal domain-containing protein n=1 Tax=Aspergillus wentii DTO 134E9 TaxID=1073089 RepID=A0A1L9R9G4_ASPWE|nr:uncharacterized protein ASPWEDRAFT_62678 [Aspergillus wentii DTO 134E9]OJJ31549.1 hypothetical protein ASPWEDRAFT_62678 [Aspergillus wentii DTO 134E9]
MGSNFEVVDIFTVSKLACDLYHNCSLATRDAPDGFRQLVTELASFQGVLRALCDDVNSNTSFFEELEENRKRILERCMNGCYQTLQRLRDLLTKYRNMGIGDEKQFWQRLDSRRKNSESISEAESHRTNVKDAVTSAMQQLHQVRLREQSLRPLRYEPQDRFHRPDADLLKKFDESAHDELRIRRLSTGDWLRVAVWWLLKARSTLANCDKANLTGARGSISPSIESRTTSQQAYIDILKASYILYDIVLRGNENSQAILADENRKLIADLSEGIKEELSQFSAMDVPEYSILHSQNFEIWESLQSEESLENGGNAFIGLGNARWITVEQEDAGDEEEKVLFRTFVNAGIGGKKFRMRTKGAPYMLLLSTRDGESEPKITICNQSGTLCLQRDFVPDDLVQLIGISHASLSGVPGAKISEPVLLKFESISVSISFQYGADLLEFINIPKAYFDAVWQREPMDSDQFSESVLFRGSVEIFEQLKAPSMKSMNPRMVHRSCQVRILERSFGEAWRTVRRIVISSSAAEKIPRSMELFMPMANVQINREEASRQVVLKWSDTCQEKTDTDGNYNKQFSYVYDHSNPNIGMSLHFRNQAKAEEFEQAILSLSIRPSFSWTQASSSGCVYDVVDTVLDQKQYKTILLHRSQSSWKYCDIFYLYRDTNYTYEHSGFRVQFPRIYYTDYISSHVDKLYRADSPVIFSHCEKKVGKMTVEFSHEPILRAFMSALATSYELLFSRNAHLVAAKEKTLFVSKKWKGGAEVKLWRTGNSVQLASRWNDRVTDKWLTMSIPPGALEPTKDGNQVSFSHMQYSLGTVLDMAHIITRNPTEKGKARLEGTITITFMAVGDREEFVAALERDYQQFLTPVVSDGGFDVDDAASAGIIRSKITRSHRIWSSSRDTTAGASESNGSSSTASLRRMIRPPLDKARSLFVLPTTTTTGQNVVISYWAPPAPVPLVAVQPLSAVEMTRRRIVREESGSLSVERKHRRCHSEQPRAWRKPSASLWPLEEE